MCLQQHSSLRRKLLKLGLDQKPQFLCIGIALDDLWIFGYGVINCMSYFRYV